MLAIVSDGTTEFLCGIPEDQLPSTGWKHALHPQSASAWAAQLGITSPDQIPNDKPFVDLIGNTV